RAVPRDVEAQHKVKDLAASATIAKGKYEQAIQGDAPTPLLGAMQDTDPDQGAADGTQPNQPALPASNQPPLLNQPPAHASRDLTNLLAKVQANPNSATAHLQLASYYRRLDQV